MTQHLALDIDDTITADPDFFHTLALSWLDAGHTVHIVTSRSPISQTETINELRGLGMSYTALYMLPTMSEAQLHCPHNDLNWYERFLWQKVAYALTNGITHFVDDDPKVISLLARFAPEIEAIHFNDRHKHFTILP